MGMLYQKQLQRKYQADVIIAGGGAAGVAAAIAAAKQGKKVLLIEAQGALGGLGTSGMVPCFATFSDGEKCIAKGIGWDIRQSVSKDKPLEWNWTPIDAEELKRTYDKLLVEHGVEVLFFTTLYDVIVENGKVEELILGSKTGLFTAKAKIYIDCTGDGDLCAFGGADFAMGDENGDVMGQTLCSLWANVDWSNRPPYNDNTFVDKAVEEGALSARDKHISGFFYRGNGLAGGNIGHIYLKNPTDEKELSLGMIQARQSLVEYENYYKKYLGYGYENASICATAPMLGVRETRRITCDYTLGVRDFLNRAVFEDEIGRYSYAIDIHEKNDSSEEHTRFEKEFQHDYRYKVGESYGIPYRCLIPVSFSNVLVAGRCVGTDREMQGSIRVMPSCFLTGQAAGTAAALAVESENVRSISIKQLQKALLALGAYLPNFQE